MNHLLQSPDNNRPLVSIIIPFLNQEKFLREAIESVLSQSYENWELLLVDDASTDSSPEIAREFIAKYPNRIYLFKHEASKGASAARHSGIQHARGDYIAFLDSDDVYFNNTIERELQAFEENPQADAVCGTIQFWYSWSDEAKSSERDFIVDLLLEVNKLYHPNSLLIHNLRAGGRKPQIAGVMLRQEFAENFRLYGETFNYSTEDHVFWAKASLHGKIYVMDACLAKYRLHPASTCATLSRDEYLRALNLFLEWLEKYLYEQKITDEEVWKSLKNFQRGLRYEIKFKRLKDYYHRLLPLHVRFWLRDRWTKLKYLLRTPHR